MNAELVVALEAVLPGQVEADASSATLTTYRCGGPLAVLVRLVGGHGIAHDGKNVIDTFRGNRGS